MVPHPLLDGRYRRYLLLLLMLILAAVCLIPFASAMSGWIYLLSALSLNAVFVVYAARLYAGYTDQRARGMFRYSITYLFLMFAALLLDHYWRFG